MTTRHKLALLRLVIGMGCAAIAAWQWQLATHKETYGNHSFGMGMPGTLGLAAIMAGIPAVIFAVAVDLAGKRLLFRRGELEEFHARARVEAIKKALAEKEAAARTPPPSGELYDD